MSAGRSHSILVAGGASGIGLATALRLAAQGDRVTILGDDPALLEQACADARQAGSELKACCGDVSVTGDAGRAVACAVEHGGALHGLVCCAAIHPYGDVLETSEETWERTLAVNLKGAFLLARHALPHLIAQRGAIVNVASVQGSANQASVAAYATSKGALLALTRTLAIDFGPRGVRANTVSPGPVATPMLRIAAERFDASREPSDVYAEFGRAVPLCRVASAVEIAAVIAFLLSSDASYCNGADFVVDGGLLAALTI